MNLTNLRVTNYRGLRDVSLPLSNFVCITGENNGGKSTILQALSLFLSGSTLKATDYFQIGEDITISVTFSKISESDLQLLAEEHRSRISTLLIDHSITFVRRYGTDGKSQLGYYGLVPKDRRFHDEAITLLVKGKKGKELKEVVLSSFPELVEKVTAASTQGAIKDLILELGNNLPEGEKEERFISLPTGFDKSVLPMLPERIYIPAVKDFADETKTAETSSFGKILAIVMNAIEPLLAEEKDLFERLSKKLTRLVGADGVVEDNRLEEIKTIERILQKFVRESFANVSLEIEIPPPELKSVLSTARIIADDGVRGPLEQKGDGLRRAVVFSILRAYVQLARATAASQEATGPERGYLLLFEEPELFLHPDAQRILFLALGVFSQKHNVVVTTHSPLFLGPQAIATFVRVYKSVDRINDKPYTKTCHVDLGGMSPRDEFQIVCFENNNAAFFSKRIVLVEGDSDFIVFPFIAETLNDQWNCNLRSVGFIRVGGKGSIGRYRKFFARFDVPVFVIADLDILGEDFDKLDPTDTAKAMRVDLLQKADKIIVAENPEPKTEEIKKAQAKPGIRRLWEEVKSSKAAYDADKTLFATFESSVESFFAWEKVNLRRECIRLALDPAVKAAKVALLWELRKSGVCVLEVGALDDYYPADITGSDKPSRAQSFKSKYCTRELLLPLSPLQTSPIDGKEAHEFEFICSHIFAQ